MVLQHKSHPAFAGGGLSWVAAGSDSILAFLRSAGDETLLFIHNLLPTSQHVRLDLKLDRLKWTDLFTGQSYTAEQHQLSLELEPYQYLWLL
jgi:hypothetical protein